MTEEAGTTFQELSLAAPVLKTLKEVGYEIPTPIQRATIPLILAGRDVIGQAQTGTGKTAAFALPLLSRIDLARREVQVLVLAPTRELAIQVAEAFQRYAAHLPGFHVLPIYGGQAYDGQLRSLKRGVHVVVGTPGRVMDHMRRKTLRLDKLSCLVLDEADEMMNMGFIDDIEWILEQTPSERQTALFSATMPAPIRRIAERHLRNPEHIAVKESSVTAAAISQYHWMVNGKEHKIDALTRILEAETFDGVLIFVRTRIMTVELAEKLEARGYASAGLSGDMPQNRREKTVDQLKKGKLDILVATDVAARGLDIDRISHVINFDIPADAEAYIHRIGRTGRAGRTGKAILFVAPRERRLLYTIERATKRKIALLELPSTEAINDQRIDRFKEALTEVLASEDLGIFRMILEQYRQEHNVPAVDIASALAKMVQGDEPLLLAADLDHARTNPRRADHSPSQGQSRSRSQEDRPPMEERPGSAASSRPAHGKPPQAPGRGMERFRVEVGRNHDVEPGNLVGAITSEAGLTGSQIGRIDIRDDYSTIDLPEGMRSELFESLNKVRVRGHNLRLSVAEGNTSNDQAAGNRPTGVRPTGDRPTGDRPRSDGPRSDWSTVDRPTVDRPKGDDTPGDHASRDHWTGDKTRSDKSGGDKSKGGKDKGAKKYGGKKEFKASKPSKTSKPSKHRKGPSSEAADKAKPRKKDRHRNRGKRP